jgi:hypothetical protein
MGKNLNYCAIRKPQKSVNVGHGARLVRWHCYYDLKRQRIPDMDIGIALWNSTNQKFYRGGWSTIP